VLEGQVLEHVLRLGKIEVLSARARYRAPNARALLIIAYNDNDINKSRSFLTLCGFSGYLFIITKKAFQSLILW
jgi:hypothetical protein